MQEIFKKRQDESDEDCIYRICALKEELGYTWPEIAEVLNQILEKDYKGVPTVAQQYNDPN